MVWGWSALGGAGLFGMLGLSGGGGLLSPRGLLFGHCCAVMFLFNNSFYFFFTNDYGFYSNVLRTGHGHLHFGGIACFEGACVTFTSALNHCKLYLIVAVCMLYFPGNCNTYSIFFGPINTDTNHIFIQ